MGTRSITHKAEIIAMLQDNKLVRRHGKSLFEDMEKQAEPFSVAVKEVIDSGSASNQHAARKVLAAIQM
jgi:hypothetical protein|tara:strand:- start:916 stop:1122 length:207 start_codon:yes stop_codon:yes gene_type:complete